MTDKIEWDKPWDDREKKLVAQDPKIKECFELLDELLKQLAEHDLDYSALDQRIEKLKPFYFFHDDKYQNFTRQFGTKRSIAVVMKNYIDEVLKKLGKESLVDSFSDTEEEAFKALCLLRKWILNFCNDSTSGEQVAKSGLISDLCAEIRQATELAEQTGNLSIYHEPRIYYTIVILWNCSSHGNQSYFREAKAIETLVPLLKCPVAAVHSKVMMTLCYIVDESENHHLISNGGASLDFIINALSRAVQHTRLYYELPEDSRGKERIYARALCSALGALARVEQNKKWIAEKKGIPPIVRYLEETVDNVRACQALWQLAFDPTARAQIKATKAISLLERHKDSDDSELKETARGALWELRDRPTTQQAGAAGKIQRIRSAQGSRKAASDQTSRPGHVMLSYNSAFRPTVIKMRDVLQQQGYNTWMDVDQMESHLYESMASAVEEALCVITFFSETYKDSAPCRSEACYAQDRRIPIIPVKVELGYKPDGWLGFLIAGRKFIDMSGKKPFETSSHELLERIKEDVQKLQKETSKPAAASTAAPAAPSASGAAPQGNDVAAWSTAQVAEYLSRYNVQLGSPQLKALDGLQLECLKEMSQEVPEFFHNYLLNKMGIEELPQLAAMRKAISQLRL